MAFALNPKKGQWSREKGGADAQISCKNKETCELAAGKDMQALQKASTIDLKGF